jgi:hypothetical protein
MNPETPDHRTSPTSSDRPGVPRWVKIFAVVGAAIAALVVVLLLSGHGPSQHGLHGSNASSVTLDIRR